MAVVFCSFLLQVVRLISTALLACYRIISLAFALADMLACSTAGTLVRWLASLLAACGLAGYLARPRSCQDHAASSTLEPAGQLKIVAPHSISYAYEVR